MNLICFFKKLSSAVALTTIAAIAAIAATASYAEDFLPEEGAEFTKWGAVEGWTVWADPSHDNCFVERVDDNENVVQMGLTANAEFGYLGVFTKADVKQTNGTIHILFDGKQYYGDANAQKNKLAKGYKGGYIFADVKKSKIQHYRLEDPLRPSIGFLLSGGNLDSEGNNFEFCGGGRAYIETADIKRVNATCSGAGPKETFDFGKVFIDEGMNKYVMNVFPEDANTFEVSLDGTFKAMVAARECNEEQID